MTSNVEISGLTKLFGSFVAVDGISFTVSPGEVLGFLGPNGAGKSTTMKMITGFLTPDAGWVRVGGDDVADKPVEVKRRIGYLPEGAPLYGDMTARSFLRFIAEIRGLGRAEAERRTAEVIEQVNLHSVIDQRIETLSKGFKRRVGLAQAILHDPEVLILDEPTDGLDPNQKYEVRNLIQAMSADKVIILSTHILEEVEAVCSRAIIIASGRVVVDGTPAELEARSTRHNAVCLTVRGRQAGSELEGLRVLPGVAAVELLDSGEQRTRFDVLANAGESVIEAVSAHVVGQGWEVEELHVERGRLDDVFREITTAASAARG